MNINVDIPIVHNSQKKKKKEKSEKELGNNENRL
jgi:hypothetical protein